MDRMSITAQLIVTDQFGECRWCTRFSGLHQAISAIEAELQKRRGGGGGVLR